MKKIFLLTVMLFCTLMICYGQDSKEIENAAVIEEQIEKTEEKVDVKDSAVKEYSSETVE